MTPNNYQNKVEGFMNPETIKDAKRRLTNAVLGLTGESGECADMLKKAEFHGKEFDKAKFQLELGDVAFYLAEACSAIDTTLEDVLLLNVEKLSKRYPNGFNTADSIAKKDEHPN